MIVTSTHPVVAFAPRCGWRDGREDRDRCKADATVWLYAPDGKPNPAGELCDSHAAEVITDIKDTLGEEWFALPLVYPCEHSCDPRRCRDCNPNNPTQESRP